MRLQLDHPTLQLAIVTASPVQMAPSPDALVAQMRQHEAALRAGTATFDEPTRAAIRDVLRVGGYKPTGRGKPASEYLAGAALAEGLPLINVLVDANNLVSLQTAQPISIFDANLLGDDVCVRFGRAGESYVFNTAGHAIDLEGLPVVCRGGEPVGNAVKDSIHCKVGATTTRICAVVYGTNRPVRWSAQAAAQRLGDLLAQYAGALHVTVSVQP